MVVNTLQVPLEELDLRRLREAAEEMREQLGVTSKAVSSGVLLGIDIVGLPYVFRSGAREAARLQQQVLLQSMSL